MAQLTPSDYDELRRTIYTTGGGKDELKARAALPNEAQLVAAFQALEDRWENNRLTLKGDIDTALGFTTTATLAKKIGLAWLIWKATRGG